MQSGYIRYNMKSFLETRIFYVSRHDMGSYRKTGIICRAYRNFSVHTSVHMAASAMCFPSPSMVSNFCIRYFGFIRIQRNENNTYVERPAR